jgi:hypothetical protein
VIVAGEVERIDPGRIQQALKTAEFRIAIPPFFGGLKDWAT